MESVEKGKTRQAVLRIALNPCSRAVRRVRPRLSPRIRNARRLSAKSMISVALSSLTACVPKLLRQSAESACLDRVDPSGKTAEMVCDPEESPLTCPVDCPLLPPCCEASPGPGCPQNPECEEQVCLNDPFHVSTAGTPSVRNWPTRCAESAPRAQVAFHSCGTGSATQPEDPEICPEDCGDGPAPPFCGDGICDEFENLFGECPSDCQDEPPVGCGDGICDDSEDVVTCPEDCEVPAASCIGFCGAQRCEYSR